MKLEDVKGNEVDLIAVSTKIDREYHAFMKKHKIPLRKLIETAIDEIKATEELVKRKKRTPEAVPQDSVPTYSNR